jgi:uncharacterized protein with HEPN domain
MRRDDSVYLQHIVDAITRIESYLANADEESSWQHRFCKMALFGR